jgi:dipeptidyl aminopeptidase/acylaminoacyl peptidase
LLFYRKILDYDPLPPLEKLNCPALIIYGELDSTVPVQGNLQLVQRALQKSGATDYKILVLPRGNHALLEATIGSNSEFFSLKRFVPGFFNSMTDWIHQLPELQQHQKSL